ncbi:MAG TPA: SRPBCC domain-containing protein [Ilumatobacteraceae bacterium]|nr:SRPBCC domain-containing protein [Ilumatobacteraceae bacterium]
MALQLFKKTKQLEFERSYTVALATVWRAWTEPEMLRQWWGPEHTTVTDCEIDLRVGGAVHIVMEAGEGMGKYQGTRWPMAGTFTAIDDQARLTYDARSWTDGDEAATTIEHTNDITFAHDGGATVVRLAVTITKIGPKAKMAAFGMKWGYKAQLDKLDKLLAAT